MYMNKSAKGLIRTILIFFVTHKIYYQILLKKIENAYEKDNHNLYDNILLCCMYVQ
jgi:hypothetical protein